MKCAVHCEVKMRTQLRLSVAVVICGPQVEIRERARVRSNHPTAPSSERKKSFSVDRHAQLSLCVKGQSSTPASHYSVQHPHFR